MTQRHDAAPSLHGADSNSPGTTGSSRPSLADQQAALVAALTGNGPIPPGFDAQRVQAAAGALAAKRARAVVQAWPGLRTLLGSGLRVRFDAYAARVPLPELGGPLADGRAFVRALRAQMALTDDVRLQALAVDQRWRVTRRGLVRRRVPRVGFAWLRTLRGVTIAIGTRELRLVLPRLRG